MLTKLISKTCNARAGAETHKFKENTTSCYAKNAVDTSLREGLKVAAKRKPKSESKAFCSKTCDAFGNHLFSCSYSKTLLHNAVHNTIFIILSTLATLASLVHSKFDILMEPSNLLPL
jgi:hypothetical protein